MAEALAALAMQRFTFLVEEEEVNETLAIAVRDKHLTSEKVVEVVYQPQALFRVRPVGRCTGSMEGHTEAVLHVRFSPDGRELALYDALRTKRKRNHFRYFRSLVAQTRPAGLLPDQGLRRSILEWTRHELIVTLIDSSGES